MTQTRNLVLAALLAGAALPALAADLTIGRSNEPSSIDPQFSRTGNNYMTSELIFGRMIDFSSNFEMSPGLAVEWTAIDPTTWEIVLREGVHFHDGSLMTADDVLFSLDRTDKVPNSPAPFGDMVSMIASMEKVDDLTIRVTTNTPAPRLMEDIGRVFIVSKAAVEGKTSDDFQTGDAAIGTGPYRYGQWTPGASLTITAFGDYWGVAPEFKDVDIRFIANDAARVAALLSGSVDVIDAVPPTDVPRLKADPNIDVVSAASGRVIYLGLSQRFDAPEDVTDTSGAPLGKNPFQDVRVRKAVSLMIDRPLIVDRILGGSGIPAGQLIPDVLGGYAEGLEPDAADLDQAKNLLTEAGYPDGFGITVHSSNDRFPGDADLGQALAQMLARGGLKVNGVETTPYNVYSKAATAGDYSVFVFSLGSSTSTSAPNLTGLLYSYDADKGTGAFNRARYSNPAFDAAMDAAMSEADEDTFLSMLADATRLAFEDMPIVPLYWQEVHWGVRKGLTITGGLSEDTLAQDVRSK